MLMKEFFWGKLIDVCVSIGETEFLHHFLDLLLKV
jgi:hypothetical protein